jgi:sugar/nucleoside kinase (ribokinase family)
MDVVIGMKVVVLGNSALDRILHVPELPCAGGDRMITVERSYESIGSTGAGKALGLDVLGVETTLITDLGPDAIRDKVLAFFATTQVRVLVAETDRSTAHTNLMYGDGNRLSLLTSNPTSIPDILPDAIRAMEDADVVFLNINPFCRSYIPRMADIRAQVVVDLHDYDGENPYHKDFYEAADILFVSDVHLNNVESFMRKTIDDGKDLVVVTKGSRGAIAMDRHKRIFKVPAYQLDHVVDTNGAGDAFSVGFVVTYLATGNMDRSLRFASACGALACTSEELFLRSANPSFIQDWMAKKQ